MTGDRQNEPTAPVHPGGERWIVDGGDGCTTEFDTEAEAVAYADACIQDWCDEGWMEEVDNIFVARLTHRSQRQVVAVQGEVSDEEWERVTHGGSGYSEWWEYTIEPVGSTPQAPTVDSDELRRADGAGLIAAERQRQIDAENWTPEHDDTHTIGELVDAAVCYLRHGLDAEMPVVWPWPWTEDWWKPSDDPIKNLVRAGALIAAEIDRLTRAAAGVSSDR